MASERWKHLFEEYKRLGNQLTELIRKDNTIKEISCSAQISEKVAKESRRLASEIYYTNYELTEILGSLKEEYTSHKEEKTYQKGLEELKAFTRRQKLMINQPINLQERNEMPTITIFQKDEEIYKPQLNQLDKHELEPEQASEVSNIAIKNKENCHFDDQQILKENPVEDKNIVNDYLTQSEKRRHTKNIKPTTLPQIVNYDTRHNPGCKRLIHSLSKPIPTNIGKKQKQIDESKNSQKFNVFNYTKDFQYSKNTSRKLAEAQKFLNFANSLNLLKKIIENRETTIIPKLEKQKKILKDLKHQSKKYIEYMNKEIDLIFPKLKEQKMELKKLKQANKEIPEERSNTITYIKDEIELKKAQVNDIIRLAYEEVDKFEKEQKALKTIRKLTEKTLQYHKYEHVKALTKKDTEHKPNKADEDHLKEPQNKKEIKKKTITDQHIQEYKKHVMQTQKERKKLAESYRLKNMINHFKQTCKHPQHIEKLTNESQLNKHENKENIIQNDNKKEVDNKTTVSDQIIKLKIDLERLYCEKNKILKAKKMNNESNHQRELRLYQTLADQNISNNKNLKDKQQYMNVAMCRKAQIREGILKKLKERYQSLKEEVIQLKNEKKMKGIVWADYIKNKNKNVTS